MLQQDGKIIYIAPMFTFRHQIRVRYSHTDKMGYVYYARYAEFFEEARVEAFRSIGLSYSKMEEEGMFSPILTLRINYYQPLFYDELVTIETTMPTMPTLRTKFLYKVYNQKGELTADGETSLVFVDGETRKPIRLPEVVEKAFEPFFKQ